MGPEGAGRALWEFRARGIGGHVGLELCCKVVSNKLNGVCGDGVRQ